MKVSIGTNVKDGPWGGGNLFAINLTNHLIKNNFEIHDIHFPWHRALFKNLI